MSDDTERSPAPPTAADTPLLDVLDRFRRAGWAANHTATDDAELRCGSCRTVTPPGSIRIDAEHRSEGASDPQDMLYVFGFDCPACGTSGAAVVAYGPTASARDQQLLAALGDDHEATDPVANLN